MKAAVGPATGITSRLNSLIMLRIETVLIGLLTPTPLKVRTVKIMTMFVTRLNSAVRSVEGAEGLVATVIKFVNVLPRSTAKLVPLKTSCVINKVFTVLFVVVVPAPKNITVIEPVSVTLLSPRIELLPKLN